jgi:hypothetical protein
VGRSAREEERKSAASRARRKGGRDGLSSPSYGHGRRGSRAFQVPRFSDPPGRDEAGCAGEEAQNSDRRRADLGDDRTKVRGVSVRARHEALTRRSPSPVAHPRSPGSPAKAASMGERQGELGADFTFHPPRVQKSAASSPRSRPWMRPL